ncbi:ferritin [Listeria monocytogenes]|uniref:ferritin n=1 Tax=Listeria monocytogenes TaxID=1639 RepID=UPI0022FFF5ED|nr:ferritin [Listeria monocytogenes]MDA5836322.1 ferritin [Listeria monocytogenes]
MLDGKLFTTLNNQYNMELQAAHSYRAMASYFSIRGYNGFANFYIVQSEEETEHAMKFYYFIISQNKQPIVDALDQPQNEFESALQVVEESLKQEKEVTESIHQIVSLSEELKDYNTRYFLNWFIEEQMEEEESFQKIITQLKGIKEGEEYFLTLDKELSKREK